MVDFADDISDRAAGEQLSGSLHGQGAFRRFKNELYQRHPDLIAPWHAFRDARARARAVRWLADEGLIAADAVERFIRNEPDTWTESGQTPALPGSSSPKIEVRRRGVD